MLHLVQDGLEVVLLVVALKYLSCVLHVKANFEAGNELGETWVLDHLDLTLPFKLGAVELVEIQDLEVWLWRVEQQGVFFWAVKENRQQLDLEEHFAWFEFQWFVDSICHQDCLDLAMAVGRR